MQEAHQTGAIMNNTMTKIHLALLDDHPIIHLSLYAVTASETDMEVMGCFSHSSELLNWLRREQCDVLILDYILQNDELDGLSLIKKILIQHPQIKILLCSSVESRAVIRTAFLLGIRGYITKREEASAYINAIRTVASGQRYIPADVAGELSQIPLRKRDGAYIPSKRIGSISAPIKLLTPREAEVIHYFLEGLSIIEISEKLRRSRKTVSGHKQSGMKKLGINSDMELFKYRSDLFN